MIEKVQINLEEETEVLLNRISEGLEDRISAEPEWAKLLNSNLESIKAIIEEAKVDQNKNATDASADFAQIIKAITNFRDKYKSDLSATRDECAAIQKKIEQIETDQKIQQRHLDYLVLPWWRKIFGGFKK